MADACQDLNIALTIDEYISTIEKMMMVHGTTTIVQVDASHNNVEFIINNKSIDELQDYSGSLNNLHEIFINLQKKHGNADVMIESGHNNAFWIME